MGKHRNEHSVELNFGDDGYYTFYFDWYWQAALFNWLIDRSMWHG